MIYCPICKNEVGTYNDLHLYTSNKYYSCKHKEYEVIIATTLYEIEESSMYVFNSIAIILKLPNGKVYEIYMYIPNLMKSTIIYNYDFYPKNLYAVHVNSYRRVAVYDGFLIDNYDYDKIVSKLNMVLNFQ